MKFNEFKEVKFRSGFRPNICCFFLSKQNGKIIEPIFKKRPQQKIKFESWIIQAKMIWYEMSRREFFSMRRVDPINFQEQCSSARSTSNQNWLTKANIGGGDPKMKFSTFLFLLHYLFPCILISKKHFVLCRRKQYRIMFSKANFIFFGLKGNIFNHFEWRKLIPWNSVSKTGYNLFCSVVVGGYNIFIEISVAMANVNAKTWK